MGGVLQTNNIHIVVCEDGAVTETLAALRASPATRKAKAKFILATDGTNLEAEDLTSGETIACSYTDFPNDFGFFLALAGITTVKQIRNNPIDIQATGRLNRLYVELLKINEEWASDERRHDMNQFMARLIFCFFAEDTDIFNGKNLFTSTIEKMSDSRSENTDYIIGELFRAMDTRIEDRGSAGLPVVSRMENGFVALLACGAVSVRSEARRCSGTPATRGAVETSRASGTGATFSDSASSGKGLVSANGTDGAVTETPPKTSARPLSSSKSRLMAAALCRAAQPMDSDSDCHSSRKNLEQLAQFLFFQLHQYLFFSFIRDF